jgi:hypothetical protein
MTASLAQRAELSQLIDDTTRTDEHLATETMRPSAKGRRYNNSPNGISVLTVRSSSPRS